MATEILKQTGGIVQGELGEDRDGSIWTAMRLKGGGRLWLRLDPSGQFELWIAWRSEDNLRPLYTARLHKGGLS